MKRSFCAVWLPAVGLLGCRSPSIPLDDIRGQHPWVWPYFAKNQPTVLAFWNTSEMQCIEDLPALHTLSRRDSSVDLVTVCTSRERQKIDAWMRKQRVGFNVLLDPDEKLASRLGVRRYPTYIFLDVNAREIDRSYDIRTIHNWFDRERWVKRAIGEELEPPEE